MKIHKLLRMTYNDISEFFGLVPGTWRPSKYLVKENGVAFPKYTANIKRRSDIWNLEWPVPLSLLSLSLSLSLGRPVLVNIRIIYASTVEPKCLCWPDWRHSKIFRNLFLKNYHWLNIHIRSPLTKSRNEHFKNKKHSYFYQPCTEKQIIQVIFIFSSFISYYPSTRLGGLMSPDRLIFRDNSPSTRDILSNYWLLLTENEVNLLKWFWSDKIFPHRRPSVDWFLFQISEAIYIYMQKTICADFTSQKSVYALWWGEGKFHEINLQKHRWVFFHLHHSVWEFFLYTSWGTDIIIEIHWALS